MEIIIRNRDRELCVKGVYRLPNAREFPRCQVIYFNFEDLCFQCKHSFKNADLYDPGDGIFNPSFRNDKLAYKYQLPWIPYTISNRQLQSLTKDCCQSFKRQFLKPRRPNNYQKSRLNELISKDPNFSHENTLIYESINNLVFRTDSIYIKKEFLDNNDELTLSLKDVLSDDEISLKNEENEKLIQEKIYGDILKKIFPDKSPTEEELREFLSSYQKARKRRAKKINISDDKMLNV